MSLLASILPSMSQLADWKEATVSFCTSLSEPLQITIALAAILAFILNFAARQRRLAFKAEEQRTRQMLETDIGRIRDELHLPPLGSRRRPVA